VQTIVNLVIKLWNYIHRLY